MATIAAPQAEKTAPRASLAGDSAFFGRLGVVLVMAMLAAFSTTYLLPVAGGRFSGTPALHLHGVLFLAWPVLFATQALAAGRSRRWHRGLGLGGIALASAMVLSGLLAIGSSIETWTARGAGLQGQTISIVAFTGLVLFAAFFTTALATIRDRASHSRWMLLATLAIMQGAWGRLALLVLLGAIPTCCGQDCCRRQQA